jgi:hypothetical protein
VIFLSAFVGQSVAAIDPELPKNRNVKTDSLESNKDKKAVPVTESEEVSENTDNTIDGEYSTVDYWQKHEDVAEDDEETSESALSFNFIYYMIEKFKFQVE